MFSFSVVPNLNELEQLHFRLKMLRKSVCLTISGLSFLLRNQLSNRNIKSFGQLHEVDVAGVDLSLLYSIN